jgi:hypothetical protein
MTNSLLLDTLLNIGSTMLDLRTCRPIYEKGWKISLTAINHISLVGSRSTTSTTSPVSVRFFGTLLLHPARSNSAIPLYYATLCGLHDLAEQLIIKHSQQLYTTGGYFMSPLGAALRDGHLKIAPGALRSWCRRRCPGPFRPYPTGWCIILWTTWTCSMAAQSQCESKCPGRTRGFL